MHHGFGVLDGLGLFVNDVATELISLTDNQQLFRIVSKRSKLNFEFQIFGRNGLKNRPFDFLEYLAINSNFESSFKVW